jgi:dihydrofolate reductase
MWKEYRDYWTNALSGTGGTANEIKYAKLASQTPHIIFSKSLKQSGWPNANINSGNLNKAISKLKKQPGKDIQIVGGAKFAAALIDSGLVDEYHLNIEPVILAKGKSVFAKLINRNTLRLTAVNKFQNGVVHVVYEQLDSRNTDKAKPGKRRDKKS